MENKVWLLRFQVQRNQIYFFFSKHLKHVQNVFKTTRNWKWRLKYSKTEKSWQVDCYTSPTQHFLPQNTHLSELCTSHFYEYSELNFAVYKRKYFWTFIENSKHHRKWKIKMKISKIFGTAISMAKASEEEFLFGKSNTFGTISIQPEPRFQILTQSILERKLIKIIN